VSTAGANAGDALNPYETLAATGAFNLYTVAPGRLRVPLLGGLDLVPDLSFRRRPGRRNLRPALVAGLANTARRPTRRRACAGRAGPGRRAVRTPGAIR
jgi:hypothetical protein